MTFRLQFSWVDAGDSIDVRSAATMAELKVTADDTVLTRHINHRSRSNGDQVVLPLYSLAAWAAAWWWPLFYEFGEDRGPGADDAEYLVRHDTAFADPGFAFPAISLRPTEHRIMLRSRKLAREHSMIEYLNEGSFEAPKPTVQSELVSLIAAVLERLESQGIDPGGLAEDWHSITSLDEAERSFCTAAGRFGLDPFEADDRQSQLIERLCASTSPELQDDMFSLGTPQQVHDAQDALRAAQAAASNSSVAPAWKKLDRSAFAMRADRPAWRPGFEAARAARQALSLGSDPVEFENDLAIEAAEVSCPLDRLVGVVDAEGPGCALSSRHGVSHRFAIARAVGGYLLSPPGAPTLLTKMNSDRQAATRAFAAEFLAPSSGLRTRLGSKAGHWIDPETVDELAEEFAVSSRVIVHQVENHRLGVTDR